jgi:hypothetical protein
MTNGSGDVGSKGGGSQYQPGAQPTKATTNSPNAHNPTVLFAREVRIMPLG